MINKLIRIMFFASLITACTSVSAQKTDKINIDGVDWFLTEIRTGQKIIIIDRKKLQSEDMGDFFSLSFNDSKKIISGKAAPNRYTAPCELSKSISIGVIASTKMFSFKEPEALNEKDFFAMLGKVDQWSVSPKGELLLSLPNNGGRSIMVFTRA